MVWSTLCCGLSPFCLFLRRYLLDVDGALWERNLHVVGVQCVVDDFLRFGAGGELRFHQAPEGDVQVHAIVSELVEQHVDSLVRIYLWYS